MDQNVAAKTARASVTAAAGRVMWHCGIGMCGLTEVRRHHSESDFADHGLSVGDWLKNARTSASQDFPLSYSMLLDCSEGSGSAAQRSTHYRLSPRDCAI